MKTRNRAGAAGMHVVSPAPAVEPEPIEIAPGLRMLPVEGLELERVLHRLKADWAEPVSLSKVLMALADVESICMLQTNYLDNLCKAILRMLPGTRDARGSTPGLLGHPAFEDADPNGSPGQRARWQLLRDLEVARSLVEDGVRHEAQELWQCVDSYVSDTGLLTSPESSAGA